MGFNELVAANPNVDPWLPTDGTQIVIPSQHILPNEPRKGIVVNIAEMRLYYFPSTQGEEFPMVYTFPIGIGRENWETPVGDPAVQQVLRSFRTYSGREPAVGGAAFSCDLGLYGDPGGMPCVLLGPRGDNLHAPDEWVLLEDIYTLTGIYAELAARWSG